MAESAIKTSLTQRLRYAAGLRWLLPVLYTVALAFILAALITEYNQRETQLMLLDFKARVDRCTQVHDDEVTSRAYALLHEILDEVKEKQQEEEEATPIPFNDITQATQQQNSENRVLPKSESESAQSNAYCIVNPSDLERFDKICICYDLTLV